MDDTAFRQLLQFFSLSWRGYRRVRKGVKKRMARHIAACGCSSLEDYTQFLSTNPRAMQKARELLTVSISRFFRDLRLWEVLEDSILPGFMETRGAGEQGAVRAWSAGCACGEEAYSLKILWHQVAEKFPGTPSLEIWATDTNPEVLERARRAVYPRSSLKNVPESLLEKAFLPAGDGLALREAFKEGIHWHRHDFLSDPPPRRDFDLIFVRNNLLTYYETPLRTPAFLRLLDALRPRGFLVVGQNEFLPAGTVELQPCRRYPWLFQKIQCRPECGATQ